MPYPMRRISLGALTALVTLTACSPPPSRIKAPCYAATTIRATIGRDAFQIPASLTPWMVAADGERRVRTEPRKTGHWGWTAYCQRPTDRPWRLRSFGFKGDRLAFAKVPGVAQISSGLLTIGFSTHSNPKRELQRYRKSATSDYLVSPNGHDFISKQKIFLGSEVEIISTPGFAAGVIAFVGNDTTMMATVPLDKGSTLPADGAIPALANLTSTLKAPTK
jgi:hypothetical protein